MLSLEEDTPLPGIRRCFNFLSLFSFRVNSFTWLCILSFTSFLLVRGPRRSAYTLGVSGILVVFQIS